MAKKIAPPKKSSARASRRRGIARNRSPPYTKRVEKLEQILKIEQTVPYTNVPGKNTFINNASAATRPRFRKKISRRPALEMIKMSFKCFT